VQDRDELAGAALLVELWHVREHVPHQMHRAPLLSYFRNRLSFGRVVRGDVRSRATARGRQVIEEISRNRVAAELRLGANSRERCISRRGFLL
jgi:hypothetical protein